MAEKRKLSQPALKISKKTPRKAVTIGTSSKSVHKVEQKKHSRSLLLGKNSNSNTNVTLYNNLKISFILFFMVLGTLMLAFIAYAAGSVHSGLCQITYTPNLGTIKYVSVETPQNQNNFMINILPITQKPMPQSGLKSEGRVPYLFTVQGQSLRIISNNLNLTSIDGQDIILTGHVAPCSHTIVLDTVKNITIIPRSTPAPQQQVPQ